MALEVIVVKDANGVNRNVVVDDDGSGNYTQVQKLGFAPDGSVTTLVAEANPVPVKPGGVSTSIFSGAHTTNGTPNTASTVRAADAARRRILIVNDSDTTVYLHLSSSGAALNSGIRLAPGDDQLIEGYTGAIQSICSIASKVLTVAEW